jgi:N-acyl-D-amino-acid deacylase
MDCYPYTASSTMLLAQNAAAAQKVLVSWSQPFPQFMGWDLDDVAAQLQCTRAEAAQRLSPGGATYFVMNAEDVRSILSHPLSMVGSDGLPHQSNPHPRLWGTFARVLGRLARDESWFSQEQAIRKMTTLPAERFGLNRRGRIQANWAADLVVFDHETIIDTADYQHPVRAPIGIRKVFINGHLKVSDGQVDSAPCGRVLRS